MGRIPYCYYEHIRSALDTMRVPLRRAERTNTMEYLRGIMTTLVGNFHKYNEPLSWTLKKAIKDDMEYLITIDDFNHWNFNHELITCILLNCTLILTLFI